MRVLEQKDGNRVGNLALKAGTRKGEAPADGEAIDVVDERGFVDGVKVARKGSKANVLGKAVEYIRVLKRREMRLKREQDGLRALIVSLENGSALLQAWETMWLEKYGGPETDEVEGEEDNEADDENEDGDEDDEGDDDDEEGTGRKRKRVKTEGGKQKGKGKPSATPAAQQEKRKRGRPRKVPLPMPTSSTLPAETIMMDTELKFSEGSSDETSTIPQVQPQRQYLLAAFAFFSFFNSPVSYYASQHSGHASQNAYPTGHTHLGSVLGSHSSAQEWARPQITYGFGWRDAVQILHLTVSFLVLVSIVVPWLPRVLRVPVTRVIPKALKPLIGDAFFEIQALEDDHDARVMRSTSQERGDERLDAALDASARVAPHRGVRILFDALELSSGGWGLMKTCKRLVTGEAPKRLERQVQEQNVILRIAQLVALDSMSRLLVSWIMCLLIRIHRIF